MRGIPVAFVLAASLAVLSPAAADAVKLTTGGEVTGSLDQLVFLAGGKQVTHAGGSVLMLWLSQTGKDQLTLRDGTKIDGELVSLKIRSIGGVLGFARKDLAELQITADARAEAVKELAARKAKIDPNDPKGLWELADWAHSKGLVTEAAELARASLKADPNSAWADKAHPLVGDIQYKGEWMTRAQMEERAKQDEEAEVTVDATGKEPDAQPAKPVDDSKFTPDQIKAIKAAIARNEELYKAYSARADRKTQDDSAAFKARYLPLLTAASSRISSLSAQIKTLSASATAAASSGANTMASIIKAGGGTTGTGTSQAQIAKYEEDLRAVKADRIKLLGAIKTEKVQIQAAAAHRTDAVRRARQKNCDTLLTGKILNEAELTGAYEAALLAK